MNLDERLAWHKKHAYWRTYLGWVIRVDGEPVSWGRDDEFEEHAARFLMFVARGK